MCKKSACDAERWREKERERDKQAASHQTECGQNYSKFNATSLSLNECRWTTKQTRVNKFSIISFLPISFYYGSVHYFYFWCVLLGFRRDFIKPKRTYTQNEANGKQTVFFVSLTGDGGDTRNKLAQNIYIYICILNCAIFVASTRFRFRIWMVVPQVGYKIGHKLHSDIYWTRFAGNDFFLLCSHVGRLNRSGHR